MWIFEMTMGLLGLLVLAALYLMSCIRVLKEYERGVIFRLGRALPQPRGPGLILVFWPVESLIRVGLRTVTKVIEPQDVITKDNVSVRLIAAPALRLACRRKKSARCG
jgi:regulator of protease activity HflC (stomatin/prohibitin superfamily)